MNKNSSNLGDEIKDIIQDVLNTNNFNRLNQDIASTVNHALRDVERMFTGKSPHTKPNADFSRKSSETKTNPIGRVSSILFMVFGFLGIGLFGCSLAAFSIAAAHWNLNIAVNGIVSGVIFLFWAASGVMAGKGIQSRKRLDRLQRYVFKISGRSYCNIKELADSIGKTDKFVAKDLQKMIHLGYFPYGHIDEKKTCLMLNDQVYKQYLETQSWAKEQKRLAKSQKESKVKTQSESPKEHEIQRELRTTIEEGNSYIAQIRTANNEIPGDEFSRKLDRLEAVTSKIFQHIETHPDQIPEIRKFMEYYLPTTLKLTTAYKELDKQSIIGENMMTAKHEIQKTLDTINQAFENLLDNLFYHAAVDISSDISVLETMLAQEGLTDKDFTIKT